MLRAGDIAIRLLHQLAHEIVDIAAHIAGLAEFGGVGFDKRNADQLRDMANEVGFPHAGRSGDDHILFGILHRPGLPALRKAGQKLRMVVVVAHRDGEDLLGFVLLDDEAVEVRFDFARRQMEIEDFPAGCSRVLGRTGGLGFGLPRLLEGRLQEGLQTLLQLIRSGNIRLAHAISLRGGTGHAKSADHDPAARLWATLR